ncbi:MAG: ABC transporter substrate-binding protein [bacterium]
MARWSALCALFLLTACGARAPVDELAPPDGVSAELRSRYAAAVEAFEAGRAGDARGRFEKLSVDAAGSALVPYVALYLGRLEAQADAGRGSEALLRLGSSQPGALGREARLYGGLAAVDARRCITARQVLGPMVEGEEAAVGARAALGLARCERGAAALALLDRAARADEAQADAARSAAMAIAEGLDLEGAAQAVARFGAGPIGVPLSRRLALLARAAGDSARLATALTVLPADDPAARAAQAALARPRIGVVLPLAGRSRPLGEALAGVVSALYGRGEDAPEAGLTVEVVDGGDPAKARAAIGAMAAKGVFGAVGLFDVQTAKPAAEAAAAAGLPLVMLTVSDAPLAVEGPVWRALHTPALVVQTAAGAALRRGGRVAAVARASDAYGESHARLFAQVWKAGGGTVIGEITWKAEKPDFAAVARQLAGAQFDTLFVPADPTAAAQFMRHLVAAGVRPKAAPGERGAWVVGTPDWYRPELLRLGGQYVEGVLIPVPFAAETARGARLAEQVRGALGREATAFDALLVDGIEALRRGALRRVEQGVEPAEALRGLPAAEDAVTPGLRFDGKEALPTLFVVEVAGGRFRPAK